MRYQESIRALDTAQRDSQHHRILPWKDSSELGLSFFGRSLYGHAQCEWRPARSPGAADTPLLYVLRNDLQLTGPQFGCGLAQCGACAVLVDGKEARSCITPVATWRPGNHDARRFARKVGKAKGSLCGRSEEHASPSSAGLDRGADSAVRILPERDDDQGNRTAGKQSESDASANQRGLHHFRAVAESLPLRNLYRDH